MKREISDVALNFKIEIKEVALNFVSEIKLQGLHIAQPPKLKGLTEPKTLSPALNSLKPCNNLLKGAYLGHPETTLQRP